MLAASGIFEARRGRTCSDHVSLAPSALRPLPTAPAYPITTYSVCCALGMDVTEVVARLRTQRTGLRPMAWSLPFRTSVGQLPEEPRALPDALSEYETRLARIALTALRPVLDNVNAATARWSPRRVGIVLGSSTAGLDTTERAFRIQHQTGALPSGYSVDTQHDFAALVRMLRELTSIVGPSYVVSTACSSGGKAFGAAQRLLQSGRLDAVLVGGVDALCELTLRGFHSLGILSSGPCRPFSSEREGINIGEGAAFFLLERAGGAPTYLLGVGETGDAHHMTAPHPDGAGAEASMRAALAQAGVAPHEVDHINAHGTGTDLNDKAEALAIARVFGPLASTVATKGYTGHALGTAGAIEAALCLASLEHNFVPASVGSSPLATEPPLNVVLAERPLNHPRVLSNSFAFGGSNVSVLFGTPV